ncbi:MAG: hypothetical protein C3F06_01160 [Candidatus Methanoperedenaceae archaeon]|nr:MAG: hypothetical protein C3F06_01160 [Candidatus Methanoperedenaceae archaeon]
MVQGHRLSPLRTKVQRGRETHFRAILQQKDAGSTKSKILTNKPIIHRNIDHIQDFETILEFCSIIPVLKDINTSKTPIKSG